MCRVGGGRESRIVCMIVFYAILSIIFLACDKGMEGGGLPVCDASRRGRTIPRYLSGGVPTQY